MPSRALAEDELHPFLRRRRKDAGPIEPPPLGQWLAETLDLAARLVPCQAGSLLLDDPAEPHGASALTFVAAFGPAAERLLGMMVPLGKGIAGHVYKTGKTYVTGDPRADAHFFAKLDEMSAFHTRSMIAVPIRLENAVCGVFELLNRRGRGGFSERDVELAELFAEYVSRAILNAVDILKQNELAQHDDLTRLRNVRALDAALLAETERAVREGTDLCVMFADVDRLKRINDRLGHHAGSEAIRRTAGAMAITLADRGEAFRFGGDEFVVVCPGLDIDTGHAVAEELRAGVRRATPGPLALGGELSPLSLSIGIATLRASLAEPNGMREPPARRAQRLLAVADKALYRAKRRGRARTARATRRDDTLSF